MKYFLNHLTDIWNMWLFYLQSVLCVSSSIFFEALWSEIQLKSAAADEFLILARDK